MNARQIEVGSFIIFLLLAFFLSWLVLAPYLSALTLAGILAFVFQPLYRKFVRAIHSEMASAISILVIVILIIFVPLTFFALRIFSEATTLYASLTSNGGFDFGAAITQFLHTNFPSLQAAGITFNVNDTVRQGLTLLIQNLGAFFSGIAQIFFTAFLSLIGLFYFLKDGDTLRKWIVETSPLAPKYTEEVIEEMEVVGGSVIKGTLVIAIAQGFVLGIGFLAFGIPNAAFWGAVTVLVSLIPIVGTWLVVVPGVAYLFLSGHTAAAIGFGVWSIILVNLTYNILAPQLMRRGADIHPFLILLSVLGGIGFFGPIGFLIGPLIIAILVSLLNIYPKLILARKV